MCCLLMLFYFILFASRNPPPPCLFFRGREGVNLWLTYTLFILVDMFDAYGTSRSDLYLIISTHIFPTYPFYFSLINHSSKFVLSLISLP